MSYVQRVFYVGEAAEPIDPVGDMTGHWVAYENATGVAPDFPISGTLVNTGAVVVQGMYDTSGNSFQPGESLSTDGVARILVTTSDTLPLGALDYSVPPTNPLEDVIGALAPEFYFKLDEGVGASIAIDTMGNGDYAYHEILQAGDIVASSRADGVGSTIVWSDLNMGIATTIIGRGSFGSGDFTVEWAMRNQGTGAFATKYWFDKWQVIDSLKEHQLYFQDMNDGAHEIWFAIKESGGTTRSVALTSDAITAGYLEDQTWQWWSLCMNTTTDLLTLNLNDTEIASVDVSSWSGIWRTGTATQGSIGSATASETEGLDGGALDEFTIYHKSLTGLERTSTYDAWAQTSGGAGNFDTADCQDEFELLAAATSYRGPNQFRMNFRTADSAYVGVLGDYAVGVPAPVTIPQLAVIDEVASDAVEADTRFYLMTYINANGYESAPGPVNPTAVHVGPDTSVQITRPLFSDVGYHAAVYGKNIVQDYVPIVAARLYRTNTGTTETGYQFVGEYGLDTSVSLVTDVENQDLGELLVTEGWDVPPPVVTAGCKMANGTYILVHEYTVYMSIPGVIYAFPVLYNQVVRDKLLHIEAVGTAAVALSDGGPYLIAGGSPDVMEIVKLPFYQACTSVRAVSVYLDLVVYPAQDGLMGVTAAGKVVNLTEGVYEEYQWRAAWALDELISEVYDGVYYAWESSTGNGFAFHIESRAFQPLDINIWGASGMTRAAGLKYDGISDSFYMSDTAGGVLYEWEPSSGVTPVEWQWASKEFYIPDRSYGACKLTGILDSTNNVNVILNVDGTDQPAFAIDPLAVQADGVCDGEYTFRLPATRGSKFILKMSTALGAPEVHSVQVAVHPTEII